MSAQPSQARLLKNLDYEEFQSVITPYLTEILHEYPRPQAAGLAHEQAIKDMYALLHGGIALNFKPSPVRKIETEVSGECVGGIISVVVDVLGLILMVVGIASDVASQIAKEAVAEATDAELLTLEKLLSAITDAEKDFDKAKAIFSFAGGLFKILNIKTIFEAIEDNMTWYQWLISGVVFIAQITIWFTTEGAALIAEIVLATAWVAQIVSDTVHAVEVCEPAAA